MRLINKAERYIMENSICLPDASCALRRCYSTSFWYMYAHTGVSAASEVIHYPGGSVDDIYARSMYIRSFLVVIN